MVESQRRLKVIAYTASSAWGGAEMSFDDLVSRLPPNINLTVIGPHKAVIDPVIAHRPHTGRIILRPKHPFYLLAHWLTFFRLKPDIIYIGRNVPWAASEALAAALITPGARVVVIDHAAFRTVNFWHFWRTRFLSLRTDALVGVGHDPAKRMEDFYALGRGSIVPIINGIAPITVATAKNGRPKKILKVVAAGNLGPRKAFDVLIRAVAHTPNVEATICGGGDGRQLAKLAVELGVNGRLKLAGWIGRPLYEEFDVFVQTSQAESFGRALAEAMMARLPVITTPVGDVGKAVAENQAGIIISVGGIDELAKALEQLKNDKDLRKSLAKKGFELAKKDFTIERCVDDHLQLWQQLLDQPRKSRLFVRHLKP